MSGWQQDGVVLFGLMIVCGLSLFYLLVLAIVGSLG